MRMSAAVSTVTSTASVLQFPKKHFVDEVFTETLAKTPGYQVRPGQVQLAHAVNRAIEQNTQAVIEGPCGTGKGKGYLVPAIYHAITRGKRVLVVTANNALSTQLVTKDLPELQRALGWRFVFDQLKGRANYLCNDKLDELKHEKLLRDDQTSSVIRWAGQTKTGDLSDLPFVPYENLTRRITTDSDNCKGKDCSFKDVCWYKLKRAEISEAHVLVTNYHMLITDSINVQLGRPSVLAEFDVLICDEAHEIADIMRDAYGADLSDSLGRRAQKYIERFYTEIADTQERAEHAASIANYIESFFRFAREWAEPQITRKKRGPFTYRVPIDNGMEEAQYVGQLLRLLALHANRIEKTLDKYEQDARVDHCDLDSESKDKRAKARTATKKFAKASDWFFSVAAAEPERAAWVEWEHDSFETQVIVKSVIVAPELRDFVWKRFKSVIFTSATLSLGGNFDFFKRETGASPTIELTVESPFDHANRCLVITPKLVEPSHNDWSAQCVSIVNEVVERADGRTLVLCSSRRQCDEIHKNRATKHRWLLQGELPPRQLTQQFKDDETSVLVGTKSFWTGVDVPGNSLVAVVIDRIPFPSPDDPIVRRIHMLDQKAFYNYDIPRALMQLKQGVGRLIRSVNDYGVIVIMDRRVITKGWAQSVWSTLPKSKRSENLNDISQHLAEMRGL